MLFFSCQILFILVAMSQLSTTVMRWEDLSLCCGSLHSQGLVRAGICTPCPALAWLQPYALSLLLSSPHPPVCSLSSAPSAHSSAFMLLPLPSAQPPPCYPSPHLPPLPPITVHFDGSQQSGELGSLCSISFQIYGGEF